MKQECDINHHNMRLRTIVTLCTVALGGFVILITRHHLRDLGEIARTYSTFDRFIKNHPDSVFQYRPSREVTPFNSKQSNQVPKIIHQVFLTDGRNASLDTYQDALASCRRLHPDWEHKIWTDINATSFVRDHYANILPHYKNYRQSIQRANILRYLLLHHYGGVYLDLDITCLTPLDEMLHLPWLTPGAYPAGVNNAFILARKEHTFLVKLQQNIPSRDLWWPMPYVENMLTTGCMFFTNRWMKYVRGLDRRLSEVPYEDRVFVLADEHGDLNSHMLRGKVVTSLFAHGGASSWHGWDAATIVMIGKHYGYFLVLLALTVGTAGVTLWRLSKGRSSCRRRRRRSWREIQEEPDDEERLLVDKQG